MIDIPPPAWVEAAPQEIVEIQLPRPVVNIVCRLIGVDAEPGRQVWGCMVWGYGGCVILVPRLDEIVTPGLQDEIRRHEEAHCAGWPGSHPDH